jgi:regulator of protease activity HflC (stomatin/prohibitin superfamily)
MFVTFGVLFFIFVFLLPSIKIIRPTSRGLVERFGKYKRFASPGFHWIIPFVDHIIYVDITEKMVSGSVQEIITNDNLNAKVNAQIYYKVKEDEDNVKKSQYNVSAVNAQIVSLTQTTLRNIIGTLTLKAANSERNKINSQLHDELAKETASWGIDIVRAELQEIDPPKDVQAAMNNIVKAENEKIAANDFATAAETRADGEKRAKIKEAEGIKQAKILAAEGEAESIRLVNEAAEKYFVGNAQLLKTLETTQIAMQDNAKIVIPQGQSLINVIGDLIGAKE